LSSSYFVFIIENPALPSISVLMSSGIDNSGTGEASGKKFKHKRNKSGPMVHQLSMNRRLFRMKIDNSSRILPIRADAEQTSINCKSHLDSLKS
jgi:hypothetical protein